MLQGLSLALAVLAVWTPARLAFGLAPAPAGTVLRLAPAELIDRCDLCIEGRITSARAILEPGKRIDTEYAISVERTLWGEPEASRAIRLPGGVLPDGRGMLIPGLPGLAVGDEVILFLARPDAGGMRMPIGLAQGSMRVATDLHGTKRIVRDQAGLAFAGPATRMDPREARPADDKAVIEYATVITEIQVAAAARRARERSGKPEGKGGR